jgi:hypothetical protein
MTNKKQTAMGQLSFMVDSLIEEGSNLPITDERTRGYLEGLFTIKKLIEEEQIRKEQEQLHNAFDEGYFNGAELLNYTAKEYVADTFRENDNYMFL